MTNKSLKAEKTKKKLMKAALKLFSEKGYSSSTIKDIAEEANLTSGLIYHYFSSKENLLWTIIEKNTVNHEIKNLISNTSYNEPTDQFMLKVFNTIFVFLKGQSELIQMFFGESQRDPKIHKKLYTLIQEATMIITDFLKEKTGNEKQEFYIENAVRNALTSFFMYFLIFDHYHDSDRERNVFIELTVSQLVKALQ